MTTVHIELHSIKLQTACLLLAISLGACGSDATVGSASTSTGGGGGMGGSTSSGCAAGTIQCGSTCTDTAVDPENCGTCGVACVQGEQCLNGKCQNASACVPGSTESCYNGPLSTLNVGACKAGSRTCASDGMFGPCVGEVEPQSEACNGVDDNCDGTVDDGLLGTGAQCPAASCEDILLAGASSGDGIYWILPMLAPEPLAVNCDMTNDGAGWTLVANWQYADNTVGQQWISGAGVGSNYVDMMDTFKMPDAVITSLAKDRYRVRATGIACNHGVDLASCKPGDIPDYTRFWASDCMYDSTLNQTPCNSAFLDVGLSQKALTSPTQTCAWHHGLNSVVACPTDVQEIVTDHAINFFGPVVCTGLPATNACANLDMVLLRIWVR